MKIYVLGNTGTLGHTVEKYLQLDSKYEVIGVNRADLDNPGSISVTRNSYVICCLGVTPQNCKNNEEFFKTNTHLVKRMAIYTDSAYANFINISTDCVFSGNKGNYSEDDIPDPTSLYGYTKLLGEYPDRSMTIRTSFIGPELKGHKNLFDWFANNSDKEINGYVNHYGTFLTTQQVASCLTQIISNGLFAFGTFHLASPHIISKYELLYNINKIFKLKKKVTPYLLDKTINRSLVTKHDWFNENIFIPTIYYQLEELKQNVKNI